MLSENVLRPFEHAEYNGMKGLIIGILRESLLYFGEQVNIWDIKFENVLQKGEFVGINDFGNAQLK